MTSNSYTTKSTDAGIYTVTVTVTDGTLTDTQNVTVTVIDNPILVALSWDANAEPDLAGYNVYYGSSSGNYD